MTGCDTDTILTGASAASLKAAGINFVMRYISLQAAAQAGDLSTTEVASILGAGLALGIVQHPAPESMTLNAAWGAYYGQTAAIHAANLRIKAGITIFLDLEEVAGVSDVINYCLAWKAAVKTSGYAAGIYIGSNCRLTGVQIDSLGFDAYWQSMSSVPALTTHSYCMVQTAGETISGVGVDIDKTQGDGTCFVLPSGGWWPSNEIEGALLTLENDLPWLHSVAQVNSIKAAIINIQEAQKQ
jgi:hypothetical protein